MILNILTISILLINSVYSKDFYTGAVVEYEPLDSDELPSALEVMTYNADRYDEFISTASTMDVDIIVFPEYGVTGVLMCEEEDRETARQFMVMGEVGRNYCDEQRLTMTENTDQVILTMISCSAKDKSMYVVINTGEMVMCETDCQNEDMMNFYNTNFVFDRAGTLIAKYWKQNLFMEPVYVAPKEHVFTYFETDFGVTFGTFICFDALWDESFNLLEKYPNITDIVYPTAWYDEMPFMLAPLEQNGWAVGMSVNFLASDYHEPGIGAMGSGIYSPSGPLNYTYYEGPGSQMVTAQIPKLSRKEGTDLKQKAKTPKSKKATNPLQKLRKELSEDYQSKVMSRPMKTRSHPMLFEDISVYSQAVMSKGESEMTTLCYNETFCCHASYNITNKLPSITYHLLAYKGERALAGVYTIDIELCGLVLCQGDICGTEIVEGEEHEEFEFLELSAKYSNNTMVIPSVLGWSGRLPDWEKIQVYGGEWEQGKDVILALEHSALFSAALYGRILG